MIGLLRRQKQRKLDLFFRGSPARQTNLLGFFYLTPPGALAGRQNLVRHVRVTRPRRHAINLHVVIANFLRDAFDKTHDGGLRGGVNRQIGPRLRSGPLVSTMIFPLRRSIIPGSTARDAFKTPCKLV